MAQIKDFPEDYLEFVQKSWNRIKKKVGKTQKINAKNALKDALDWDCYNPQANLVKQEEGEELDNVVEKLTRTEIETENVLMKHFSMPEAMPKLIGEPTMEPSAITKVWDVLEEKYIDICDVKMPNKETYPHMCDWSPAYSNERVPNELTLRFLPSIEGDQDESNDFLAELMDSFDRQEWTRKYVYLGQALDELVEHLKNCVDSNNPLDLLLTRDKELTKDIDKKMVVYHLICAALPELGFSPEKMKDKHQAYREDFLGIVRASEGMPNIDRAQLIQRVYSADEALDTHQQLFCRRCFKYDCNIHVKYTPTFRPVKEDLSIKKVCGPKCFLNIERILKEDYPRVVPTETYPPIALSQVRTNHWSNAEHTMVNVLLQTFDCNYCSIADTLGGEKTCAEVYVRAQTLMAAFPVKARPVIKKIKRKSLAKLAPTVKLPSIENSDPKDEGDPVAVPYEPCDHLGKACDKECSCVAAGIQCEKYCNCNLDCPKRVKGCNCTGKCNTNNCPCYLAVRECDPDLCRSCEAGSLEKDVCSIRCKNINIQRGLKKRLLIGCSDIAGWGCFLNDTAEAGEFISEYCGEMISHDEADRRGVIYDKQKYSYLFNLNSEYVIDSMRKGNKIRFANHSEMPNCVPRIMFVNGDHRIGIYALRRIEREEELLFDYRYYKDQKLKFVNAEKKIK